jgi:hypothetical protein
VGVFDGTNTYVSLGAGAWTLPTAGLTVACWAYLTDTATSRIFLAKRSSGSDFDGFALHYAQPDDRFYLTITDDNIGWDTAVYESATGRTNQWVHLAATTNFSTNSSLYLNGALVSTDNSPATSIASTSDLQIGGCADASWDMIGRLADVRFYSIALTGSEVRQLYLSELSGAIL